MQRATLVWACGGSVLLRVDADGHLCAADAAAILVPRPPYAPAGPLRCLTSAPASNLVAATTGEVGGAQPSSAVLLWSFAEGGARAEPLALLPLSAPATALAFSPSAGLLAVLDKERWLSVWELAAAGSGNHKPTISTSLTSPTVRMRTNDSFSCLTFASDAKLCTASASRLAVWTLTRTSSVLRLAPAPGKPLFLPPAVSAGRGAVLTGLEAAPGGRRLWATSSNGQLLQLRASGCSYTVASCVQVRRLSTCLAAHNSTNCHSFPPTSFPRLPLGSC